MKANKSNSFKNLLSSPSYSLLDPALGPCFNLYMLLVFLNEEVIVCYYLETKYEVKVCTFSYFCFSTEL